MGSAQARSHPTWGEPRPGLLFRLVDRLRASLIARPPDRHRGLRELPLALRRGELAETYLAAERESDHRRAAVAATSAMDRAVADAAWWPADIWAHRALWHFERAGMTLAAARQARRIGELRTAAGDPDSARRYFAEAIDEARDIGAEHEQGLASLGLGRAMLELGRVTEARRLAGAAVELLERTGASTAELGAARGLLGEERAVGEAAGERP
jgi:hypothetical protein